MLVVVFLQELYTLDEGGLHNIFKKRGWNCSSPVSVYLLYGKDE